MNYPAWSSDIADPKQTKLYKLQTEARELLASFVIYHPLSRWEDYPTGLVERLYARYMRRFNAWQQYKRPNSTT